MIFPRWDRAFHFEPPFNFLLFPLPAHPSRDFAGVNCQSLFTVVKGKIIIKTVAVAPKKYSINLAKTEFTRAKTWLQLRADSMQWGFIFLTWSGSSYFLKKYFYYFLKTTHLKTLRKTRALLSSRSSLSLPTMASAECGET